VTAAVRPVYREAFLVASMIGTLAAGFTAYNGVMGAYGKPATQKNGKPTAAPTQPPPVAPDKGIAVQTPPRPVLANSPPPPTIQQSNQNPSAPSGLSPGQTQSDPRVPQLAIKGCRITVRKEKMEVPVEREAFGEAISRDRSSAIAEALLDTEEWNKMGQVKKISLPAIGIVESGVFIVEKYSFIPTQDYRILQEYAINSRNSRDIEDYGKYKVELGLKYKVIIRGVAEIDEKVGCP